MESLLPPVLSKFCNQIPLDFKVWFSGNSSSHCQTPGLGSLLWCSETSLQFVDFCGISVLQFMSHPPSSYGIWFYCDCAPPTISLWLLLCLCVWGISFGEFQCLPVDDCSGVHYDSAALARGSECMSSYSTIFHKNYYSRQHQKGSRKTILLLWLTNTSFLLLKRMHIFLNSHFIHLFQNLPVIFFL